MKGLNKGFTGVKDQDREILLNIRDDKELLQVCSLNKYLYNEVCNDIFFRNRLAKTYPDTLKYKDENINWKKYFLKVIYYIAKLKEDYKYTYEKGNPYLFYSVFKRYRKNVIKDNNTLLIYAAQFGDLISVREALNNGADIHAENDDALRSASRNGHLEVVKYLKSLP